MIIGNGRGAADGGISNPHCSRRAQRRTIDAVVVLLLLAGLSLGVLHAHAADRQELEREAAAALERFCADNTAARLLREKATAILVFPRILKAGFMFGGQIGDGVLLKGDRPSGYYNSLAGSYGFQAGAQVFGYALFFMNAGALEYLDASNGWEIGAGPSLVVVDTGGAKSISTTTITQDVYAFVFDQKGLMGGVGIQGSKITKLSK